MEDAETALVKNCLDTIYEIFQSPSVHDFIIGYTSRPAARAAQYRGFKDADPEFVNYRCFVILNERMEMDQALDLEQELHRRQVEIEDGREVHARKYRHRNDIHHRSSGGTRNNELERIHSVYMVWRLGDVL
ncbi:MAG TPA: hypothetical protein VL147_12655 [Devosia sp.]|nr:hypothetical protein [Devosia sp.]